ncbi:hypothetical protein Tco_1012911 [Tanacetum coccineum]
MRSANYKEAMASPEAAMWKEAMKSEIQSCMTTSLEVGGHTMVLRRWMKWSSRKKNKKWIDHVAMTCYSTDVSFALGMVSRHQQNPSKDHWIAVRNIFKYLRKTKDRGAVTWKSLKQATVADFTCNSEYIAACEASKEAIWMKNFFVDLGFVLTVQDPIEIFYDNESAVALTNPRIRESQSILK